MTKTVDWREGHLDLYFLNIDYTGVGDAGGLRGSVTPGSLFLSLHTSDPGVTGDQTTTEVSTGVWPAYARQAVRDKLVDHRQYVNTHGEDMPEIRDWKWPY